jgi:hypothetical protein
MRPRTREARAWRGQAKVPVSGRSDCPLTLRARRRLPGEREKNQSARRAKGARRHVEGLDVPKACDAQKARVHGDLCPVKKECCGVQ